MSESKLPILKTMVEADTIRVTQMDLINVAVVRRERELEQEKRALIKKCDELTKTMNSLSEDIIESVRQEAIQKIHELFVEPLRRMSATGSYTYNLSKKEVSFDTDEPIEIKAGTGQVSARGKVEVITCEKNTDDHFHVCKTVPLSKKVVGLSEKFKAAAEEHQAAFNRINEVSYLLKNIDKEERRARELPPYKRLKRDLDFIASKDLFFLK